MALSTVSGILARIGMGKLGRLGLEPVERYERQRPGELIHIDVKKLGRIARPGHAVLGGQPARASKGYHRQQHSLGWEFVHIAITTARAWPTSRCSATRSPPPRSPSSGARSRFTAATALPSSGC